MEGALCSKFFSNRTKNHPKALGTTAEEKCSACLKLCLSDFVYTDLEFNHFMP